MGLTLANADELIGWGIDGGYEGRKARYALLRACHAIEDRLHCPPGLYESIRSQFSPDRRGGADAIIG